VGKTDGIHKAYRELTSPRAYQSAAKNGISPIFSQKKTNIYIHPLPASEMSMDGARHARLARR